MIIEIKKPMPINNTYTRVLFGDIGDSFKGALSRISLYVVIPAFESSYSVSFSSSWV